MKNLYKMIPKVDEILNLKEVEELTLAHSRNLVVDAIRRVLDQLRQDIREGIDTQDLRDKVRNISSLIETNLASSQEHSLKKVVNATGVVLHTNMGRAPISQEVIEVMREISTGYSNLEYDLAKGSRGQRYSHLDDILTRITGAEAAMVVNNNAAAVMLILSTFAKGKEVLTSRGELIEIGGSFRVPDVMEESGARLVEVGTTNKTHLKDYARAIGENTAAIFKVHSSNYRVLGFTQAVTAQEMMPLKEEHDILILEDLGSGVLIDLSKYGLEYEPRVQDSIESGVDLVSFSGDKLLGGPQAGIIVGRRDLIEEMKKNPLTRALRVDKFVIAALETILTYYLDEEIAINKIPTLRMLTYTKEELKDKAHRLLEMIQTDKIEAQIVEVDSEVGGGSLPLEKLPSYGLAIQSDTLTPVKIEKKLRTNHIPVIVRIIKDRIVLDVRTIDDGDMDIVKDAINRLG